MVAVLPASCRATSTSAVDLVERSYSTRPSSSDRRRSSPVSPQHGIIDSETSGKSNLTKRSHRRRTRTVQSYSPGGASVHHHLTHASLGPSESMPQTASRSVKPFLHSSRKVPILYNGTTLSPENYPCTWEDLDPPSNRPTCFLGSSYSAFTMISRSIQPFLHSSWHRVLIVYNGPPTVSLHERSDPSNTWFLGSTRIHNLNDIWIGSAIFAWLTILTNRQTDYAAWSVTTGCI